MESGTEHYKGISIEIIYLNHSSLCEIISILIILWYPNNPAVKRYCRYFRLCPDWLSVSSCFSACNCHRHSFDCYFDPEVDQRRESLDIHRHYRGGGVCLNCQVNNALLYSALPSEQLLLPSCLSFIVS